jgi:hypothetical protein
MPDDSQFLAASHAALEIVESFGNLPGKGKAESVGWLTFRLLDLLKSQERGIAWVYSAAKN